MQRTWREEPRSVGEVWASGRNDHGQLGNKSMQEPYLSPTPVPPSLEADLATCRAGHENERRAQAWMPFSQSLGPVQSAACGSMHSVLLARQPTPSHSQASPSLVVGALFSTGSNNTGQLGLSHKYDQTQPTRVEGLYHSERCVLDIQCGAKHNVAVAREYDKDTTEVWTWGQGWYGRLGHGDELFKLKPAPIVSLTLPVIQVTCGRNTTGLVTAQGHVYTWGYNRHGQCGLGVTMGQASSPELPLNETGLGVTRPVRVPDVEAACWISMGHQHSVFLSVTGKVYACGANEHGQLGTGSVTGSEDFHLATFTLVEALPARVQAVRCGGQHTLALTAQGAVYAWGRIERGRCGLLNVKRDANVPRLVTSLQGVQVTHIAAGDAHNLALTRTGRVYGWGMNKYAQLGVMPSGEVDWEPVPRLLEHLRGVSDVYVGGSCAAGSSYFLIDSLPALLRQHVRDLNSTQVARVLQQPGAAQAMREWDEEGYNALHWATLLGAVEIVGLLLDHPSAQTDGALVESPTQDGHQHTALHLSATHGYAHCLTRLLRASVRGKVQPLDAQGQTPAHLAVAHKHFSLAAELIQNEDKRGITPTSLLWSDRMGRTLLDMCSLEEAFLLKNQTSAYYDVFLIFAPDQAALGEELARFLTSKSVKCCTQRASWTPARTRQAIEASRCVVFVVGPSSVRAEAEERAQLMLAKQCDLSIFPIWHEKITLEPDMEAIIFRFQLVDFSLPAHFSLHSNILCAAIKSTLARRKKKAADEDASKPARGPIELDAENEELVSSSAEGPFCEQVLFLSYVEADLEAAAQVKAAFQQAGEMKLFDAMGSIDASELSRAAQSCFAVLVLVSPASVHSSMIREQILVAENNKKPLFSLQVTPQCENVPLDFRYALAITPCFLYHPLRPQDSVRQILRALRLKHQVDQKGRQYSILLENVRDALVV